MNDTSRTLFPETEPFDTGRLAVEPPHEIYYEQYGNPRGKPALFVHGGPGGGSSRIQSRFWDPRKYRIVLFDQRGCGKSTPHASLENNTTWHLVADMEKLREHLAIARWQVFGGSWGSTLALVYAQAHPERVTELVLRGIFTFTQGEMEWFYGGGTATMFPDAWAEFIAPIPEHERHDLMTAYHRRLIGDDPKERSRCAIAWSLYECRVATLLPDPEVETHCQDPSFTLPFARIECHYFVNRGFLDRDGQLLEACDRISNIPTTIVHGRYDVICPARNAWDLHRRLPHSKLVFVDDAGHSAFEPGIITALLDATDGYVHA
jgi:proline iminopeptidase